MYNNTFGFFDEEDEFDNDPVINSLLDLLRPYAALPRVVDTERLRVMQEAVDMLKHMLSEHHTEDSYELVVEFNEVFNNGTIKIRSEWIAIHDTLLLAELCEKADDFEINPLINNRVELIFSFNSVLRVVK